MVDETSATRKRASWLERVRHVAWAGLIALVLNILTLFFPIDQLGWMLQSRLADEAASGDIVFIGSDIDLADPARPQSRGDLASLIRRLDAAGAESVFVDFEFAEEAEAYADADLNAALRDFTGESYLVRTVSIGLNGQPVMPPQARSVAEGVDQLAYEAWVNFMGYTWEAPIESVETGERLPNFPVQLAGDVDYDQNDFPISYAFNLSSIPTYRFTRISGPGVDLSSFNGKRVVIGPTPVAPGVRRQVPGHLGVGKSIVAIYGAETLKAGYTEYINGLTVLLATLAALLLACAILKRRLRYWAYAAVVAAIPVALVGFAEIAVRVSVADALVLLIIFAIFRTRAASQRKMRLVDSETNLPTMAALEADSDIADGMPAIIVAKIHRFEEVRRTLSNELHAEYVLAIIARLKAATQDATIYLGQGHLIAWTMHEKDPALLREHLEGLRALFASPLTVGDEQVDVGITFGIDITPSPAVARRLAAAIAAAEKTNETFEPIAIADSASQEDLIWNISLQARIDAALSNGEIYLAFQPKILVQTGEIVGAEALVRWKDPVKGHIPPDYFIRQCETAGRMSQLTRFVLEEACRCGNAFEDEGLHLPIAVNISATLLHERAIVTMVADVLEQTGFDPSRLTLEITETYRISNLDLAAEILGELKALGTKISMDDFGVGAASLEALLRLPFSELKIDRIFIAPMTSDPKALSIVKSVLQLGRDLRIIVVAEGVEDAGTLTLLRDSGCVVAQGFAISRPVRFEKILQFHMDEGKRIRKNMV